MEQWIDGQQYQELVSKIIFLGNVNVGKTALIWRYSAPDVSFSPGSFSPTIGLDFTTTIIPGTPNHRIGLWDTAGHERFKSFLTQYFRGVDGVVFVYDVGNRSSFEGIDKWVKLFRKRCDYTDAGMEAKAVLVGNKCDISIEDREVSAREGKMKAEELDMLFFETSALLGINVREMIEGLASKIAANAPLEYPSEFVSPGQYDKDMSAKKGGCC